MPNIEVSQLYCWKAINSENFIYTDTLTIQPDTLLYNRDHSIYTPSLTGFHIVGPIDGVCVVCYQSMGADRYSSGDKPPVTLYPYTYVSPTSQNIWANSPTYPAILYQENGDEYSGYEWSIHNGEVLYLNKYPAQYDSSLDKTIPFTVNTTSYIIDRNNRKTDFINSEVGVVSVIKSALTRDQLRFLSLLLTSSIGKSPSILLS